MHVVSKRMLREFWREHADAETPLDVWYRTAKNTAWQNLAEVKIDFPHADKVGTCIVFNIGGNKYRLSRSKFENFIEEH